jgi:hypothetical protein
VNKCCIKISRYFFLIIFLGFFGSNTFFDHTHLYDGNLIVHSHPFKADPDGKPYHGHKDAGYLLINFLNNIISDIVITISLISVFLFTSGDSLSVTIISFRARLDKALVLLRGPPSMIPD